MQTLTLKPTCRECGEPLRGQNERRKGVHPRCQIAAVKLHMAAAHIAAAERWAEACAAADGKGGK